ncbi:hypothetical protein BDV25DRAFT_137140 [Aspergillus avenaceus]|uniref:DUF6594 domain-containing protein n=1 Tax=Aspergillus avenaceus TaxID=36643 RepID=A0A5N6U3T6_ASPAV|nr:hypothetical protein BDV25DRAFT_137140 [Aspergillus avenaceus]
MNRRFEQEMDTPSARNSTTTAFSRMSTAAQSLDSETSVAASAALTDLPLTQIDVDEKPWKYIGYHAYSRFLAFDSDFYCFRRLEQLNTRVIVALQNQLAQIEESLDEIDKLCSRREAPDVHNGTFRNDTQDDRVNLIWEAYRRLESYNRFLNEYAQLRSRATATERDITSLKNWHYNHEGAIKNEEAKYIDGGDLLWQKHPPSELPLHVQQHVHYSSDRRIDQFVTLTIITVGLLMLISPIWILAFIHPVITKLTVITLFILLFLILVSLGTNSKPYESLAATAAYSAILMVFLQLGSGEV